MRVAIRHEIPGRMRFDILDRLVRTVEIQAVEQSLRSLAGVYEARMSARTARLVVVYEDTGSTRDEVLAALERFRPEEVVDGHPTEPDEVRRQRDALVRSAFRLALGNVLVGAPKTALSIYGSLPFLQKGLQSLLALRLDAELLDAAAIATATRMGDHGTASVITFLLRLADYLRLKTEAQAMRDLAGALARHERDVWVRQDGREVQIKAGAVAVGDTVVLRPGYVVPVDGVVVSGRALVDQSSLTGEDALIRKRKGTTVYEGTTVIHGHVDVEALRVGDDTRMARIVSLVEEGSAQKAQIELRASKLADKLVPYVFSAAGIAGATTLQPERAASVLLVDYSCALKLSIPIAIKTCMIEALRHGILIRGGKFIEALSEVDTLVFDKTGTLTEARPTVVDVMPIQGFDRATLVKTTACVEEHFPHPMATAILEEAERCGVDHGDENHGEVEYLVSYGIVSSLEGKRFVVGSRRLLEQDGIAVDPRLTAGIEAEGRSIVYVGIDGRLGGLFVLEDALRAWVPETLAALRDLGIRRTILLTGNNAANAKRVARLGFTEYHAEVAPEEKAALIQSLRDEGHRVAMVGDGINDAPALANADVGISFEHGTDLARETATS